MRSLALLAFFPLMMMTPALAQRWPMTWFKHASTIWGCTARLSDIEINPITSHLGSAWLRRSASTCRRPYRCVLPR